MALPAYVCPSCRAPVVRVAQEYRCGACARSYPILFGIPDFRLQPDAYLSLEDERAKAARLEAFGRSATFVDLLSYYYTITDDVPPHLVPHFTRNALVAESRSARALDALGRDPVGGTLLDLGCGSGAALVNANGHYASITGVDIALRWLVIARKRLAEAGVEAQLACADAEALPFVTGGFSHVLADDLIDNVRSHQAVMREVANAMSPGGRLWLSATNRHWIGPHPATGIWAAGFVPRYLRRAILVRKYGHDLLRAVALQTPGVLGRSAKIAGLRLQIASPRGYIAANILVHGPLVRAAMRVYGLLSRLPVTRWLLTVTGPAFEMIFVKPVIKEGNA